MPAATAAASNGNPASSSAHAPALHPLDPDGRERAGMAPGEQGGRRAVGDALVDEAPPRRSGAVVDDRGRLVAAPPPRRDQPPDRVDVLADAQTAVEAVDLLDRRRAGHEGGGGDVADPGAGGDAGRLGAEVEGGVGGLVAGPAVVRRCRGHARGDEADPRILEMTEQRRQPPRTEIDVGVDERHQRRGHRCQTGVAGDGGPRVRAQPQEADALDRFDRRLRPVVDDHHRGDAGARRPELREAVGLDGERRHHDGHVGGRERTGARRGMHGPGVEQPVDEPGRRHVVAGDEAVEVPPTGGAEAEQAQR